MFKSRKLKAALAVVLGSVAAALSGEVTWTVALSTITATAIGYILGVGIEDAGKGAK
jgi:hypothetical protein